jgi:hypothetical protein
MTLNEMTGFFQAGCRAVQAGDLVQVLFLQGGDKSLGLFRVFARALVVPLIALSTTILGAPSAVSLTRSFMRCADPTLVPPNFKTRNMLFEFNCKKIKMMIFRWEYSETVALKWGE